jgi:hypothetical protein
MIGWEKECADFLNWGFGRFGNWLIVVTGLGEVDGFGGHAVGKAVFLGDASGATCIEEVSARFGLSGAVKRIAVVRSDLTPYFRSSRKSG